MVKIRFLGSGGGRFNLITQKRWTGGFRIEGSMAIHVDPGPGALYHLKECGVDPTALDMLISTHAHIDHYNDLSVLCEAMSYFTKKRRGVILTTKQVIDLTAGYHKSLVEKIITTPFSGNVEVEGKQCTIHTFEVRHDKRIETFGFTLELDNVKIGYTSDTRFFDLLVDQLKGSDVLIANTTLTAPHRVFSSYHLAFDDGVKLYDLVRPKICVFTHLGYLYNCLVQKCRGGKEVVEDETRCLYTKNILQQLKSKVKEKNIVFANDGMEVDL